MKFEPDYDYVVRESDLFKGLFIANGNQIAMTVGNRQESMTTFHYKIMDVLYDYLQAETVSVTLGTVHPDFPDAVQVWQGVLLNIDDNGSETKVLLLDGREVPLYDLTAFRVENL